MAGVIQRKGDWMQTFTGKQFWPCDPRPEDVCLEDIAHALSLCCRFNGHCLHHYSVAQHSVLVSENVSAEFALYGLLHDAAEAYVCDVPRPLKPMLEGYAAIEAKVHAAICSRFGLSPVMPAEVKRVDNAILVDEARSIMARPPADWHLPEPGLGIKIQVWAPAFARAKFLQRYAELTE